jgi:hypothetical protein
MSETTTTNEAALPPATGSLFRIVVLHGAPKDSHKSTETYLVAENEQAVFDWIDKEKNYGAWTEKDEDAEEPNVRYADDDYEKEIPFREWVMLKRGDLDDEEGWENAYYGVTKWGWEPIEASPEDIAVLLRLGIANTANTEIRNADSQK